MKLFKLIAVIAAGAVLGACQTVSEKAPTIAHTHIGHTLTAWVTTPGEQGLYVVAEKEARALQRVLSAVSPSSSLPQVQAAANDALEVIEPSQPGSSPGLGYGLRRAFDEALSHLEFAAQSDDASANFRNSMPRVAEKARAISERIELVQLLAEDVLRASSSASAAPLVTEMQTVSKEITFGAEVDGRPPVGSSSEEAGLNQLRDEVAAMTARENPAYVPVAEKWLFGLIRLPSGEWKFDFSSPKAAGDGGGY